MHEKDWMFGPIQHKVNPEALKEPREVTAGPAGHLHFCFIGQPAKLFATSISRLRLVTSFQMLAITFYMPWDEKDPRVHGDSRPLRWSVFSNVEDAIRHILEAASRYEFVCAHTWVRLSLRCGCCTIGIHQISHMPYALHLCHSTSLSPSLYSQSVSLRPLPLRLLG